VFQSAKYFLSDTKETQSSKPVVFIDLGRNPFGRYLYTFVKMLNIEGYRVCIPKRLLIIYEILSNKYARLLLTDELISFGSPGGYHKDSVIFIPSGKLSPDYFRFITDSHPAQSIHVAMCQHPLMYRNGYWNAQISSSPRKNALFMAGNFNPERYSKIERNAFFKVYSRPGVIKEIDRLLLHVRNYNDLLTIITDQSADKKVVLVNIQDYFIPMSDLRQVIARFDFFFALPGVIMPLCHNIVEAMSVGSIPFLQNTYAELLIPPLKDSHNCITFNELDDLEEQILRLFLMPDSQKDILRQNVIGYYNKYMTPAALSRRLKNWNKQDTIYMPATRRSVKMLRARTA